MSFSPRDLIRILEKNGFLHKRTKGSHRLYENSETGKTVVVPVHGNKDLPKGTYYAILKQAGIEKN
ncbi:MAG TPA: type II toxin-antitoxin system HicA family toxin [Cyclobacteriaceae bacterium]|nr:type II toxin-antitoxin system HicA family toxin [Cyclobacteriaceae bacterium]